MNLGFQCVLQAWDLYERGELQSLVDPFLEGDFNMDEAVRFCKISLLCTQDSPQNRPSMSTVLGMLRGRREVNEENVTKPRMIFEFVQAMDEGKQKYKTEVENSNSGKQEDSSSSETMTSFATMTFTAIYDRSN